MELPLRSANERSLDAAVELVNSVRGKIDAKHNGKDNVKNVLTALHIAELYDSEKLQNETDRKFLTDEFQKMANVLTEAASQINREGGS